MHYYRYYATAANAERRTDLHLVMVIVIILLFAVAGLLNSDVTVACMRFAARQRHQYYKVD
tara:strand:- start:109 stop:291 length:183 start_codon:yes stop_codon:yes gene_type:complete